MEKSETRALCRESVAAKLPDVCRVCLLDETDGQTELYTIDDVYVQPNSVEHMNCFRDILSIFINDELESCNESLLPKHICTKCVTRAQEAYQFIEQCQRADKLLEQCFESLHSKTKTNATVASPAKSPTAEGTVIKLEIANARPACDDAEDSNAEEMEQPVSQPLMIQKGKRWYCDKCSKSFSQPQTLRRHYRIHDETGSSKIACPQCDRQFLRSDDLTRHIRTHTGERPYRCKLCPKKYKQGSELKEHMLTHSQEKQFRCDECNKQLASRNGLYVHMKLHRGEKPHACPHCDKRFTTSSERISHVRHIHTPRK
nr:zinc finger protein 271-like [Anopheles coluzzii]